MTDEATMRPRSRAPVPVAETNPVDHGVRRRWRREHARTVDIAAATAVMPALHGMPAPTSQPVNAYDATWLGLDLDDPAGTSVGRDDAGVEIHGSA